MEAIPGRIFYNFDGTTVKDPIQTLADAGVNAFRVETARGQCLGPTKFSNTPSTLDDESYYRLDFGCIDTGVKTAQQAVAQGMKFVLTINQGANISAEQEHYNYRQMIDAVQIETKRQLQPFLDAKLLPDIILLENEGTDGFLMQEETTGHVRGTKNGKEVSAATLERELCGDIPTGNLASYPQLAGYYKAEIQACNEAITTAGISTASVRYGLHSHGQYVQWKETLVHGPEPLSQSTLKTEAGTTCDFSSVIPADLLRQNASDLLTILGFSAYANPMTPTDINSTASYQASLSRLNETLYQFQTYAEAYGKHTDGPFSGQYKLQGLGVEYASSFPYEQVPQQMAHTRLMWKTVKKYSAFLGMMWWEPWYCNNHWEGGNATLSHRIERQGVSGEAPTDTLRSWGEAAVSSWKWGAKY